MLIQYNKIRKIKTITATITSKIEQSKELTVKSKKSSTGFLLSEVQIGANEAKKEHFSMLFAIFILLHKNEQVRTLSSLVVNMFLKSDLSFPEKGKLLRQISCPKWNVLIERWPVLMQIHRNRNFRFCDNGVFFALRHIDTKINSLNSRHILQSLSLDAKGKNKNSSKFPDRNLSHKDIYKGA